MIVEDCVTPMPSRSTTSRRPDLLGRRLAKRYTKIVQFPSAGTCLRIIRRRHGGCASSITSHGTMICACLESLRGTCRGVWRRETSSLLCILRPKCVRYREYGDAFAPIKFCILYATSGYQLAHIFKRWVR